MKTRVLFDCMHNSARSQMAEAFLNNLAGDAFEAESAGITPGSLNPNAVRVMQETGIDISRNTTTDVFDFIKLGKRFHYVITVCDQATGERCPIFPGTIQRLNWSFPDPSVFEGTHEEIVSMTRQVRDQIRECIVGWLPKVQTDRQPSFADLLPSPRALHNSTINVNRHRKRMNLRVSTNDPASSR